MNSPSNVDREPLTLFRSVQTVLMQSTLASDKFTRSRTCSSEFIPLSLHQLLEESQRTVTCQYERTARVCGGPTK